MSASGSFADVIGSRAADDFWADALQLVNKVSGVGWDKKVLARAQAPGVSADTGTLQVTDRGALADEVTRTKLLSIMTKASHEISHEDPGLASFFQSIPINRDQMDLALKLIRDMASIQPRYSLKQEALLVILGSAGETGSSFCQQPAQRDKGASDGQQWAKQERRAFMLEVWSETTIFKLCEKHR